MVAISPQFPILLMLLTALFGSLASPVAAQPAFVIDTLWVGVYAEKSTASELKQIIRTGEQVEVLVTEQGWAQIALRTAGEGWVEQSFLASTAPVGSHVSALEEEISENLQELEQLSRQVREFEQMMGAGRGAGPAGQHKIICVLAAAFLSFTAFFSGVAWRNRRLRRKFGGLLP